MNDRDTITKKDLKDAVTQLDDHITHPTNQSVINWIAGVGTLLLVAFVTTAIASYDLLGDLTTRVDSIEERQKQFVTEETEEARHSVIIADQKNLEIRVNDLKDSTEKKLDSIEAIVREIHRDLRRAHILNGNGGTGG